MCHSMVLFLLAIGLALVTEASLPGYLKPCSLSDPKFDDCLYNTARNAMKKFAYGDKERGIPPLEPLHVERLQVLGQGGDGLNVVLTDVKLIGCSDLDLKKYRVDFEKNKFYGKGVGDLVLDSTYNLTGRILILPLFGHGHARIDLRNVKLKYYMDFDWVKRENGKEYAVIKNNSIKYEIGKAVFKFDNLFNGDRILSESTHRIVNDAWKDVVAEVGPPVAKILKDSFTETIQKFFDSVSRDELYLP